MDTSVLNRICVHPTAGTALPADVGAGSNIARATWSSAGWVTIRSILHDSDDADLVDGTLSMEPLGEIIGLKSPLSQGMEEYIMIGNAIQAVSFGVYGASDTVMDLSSVMSTTSQETKYLNAMTNRAVAVEWNGVFVDYYPNVVAVWTPNLGSIREVTISGFRCLVQRYASYEGGFSRRHNA